MTTFDKREEGFEKQYAHDEELRFKATARRNRMLGLAGEAAAAYAKDTVAAGIESGGGDGPFRKIRADFDAGKVAQSDHQLQRTMDELMGKAIAEIKATG
jgi:hypothetical protein